MALRRRKESPQRIRRETPAFREMQGRPGPAARYDQAEQLESSAGSARGALNDLAIQANGTARSDPAKLTDQVTRARQGGERLRRLGWVLGAISHFLDGSLDIEFVSIGFRLRECCRISRSHCPMKPTSRPFRIRQRHWADPFGGAEPTMDLRGGGTRYRRSCVQVGDPPGARISGSVRIRTERSGSDAGAHVPKSVSPGVVRLWFR